MIIAISGCSRSGKTTLAEAIVWELRSLNFTAFCLHLDDFVKPINEINLTQNLPNWENIQSINQDLAIKTIKYFNKKFDFVLIEGHLSSQIDKISRLAKYQFEISISKETFLERRKVETRWGIVPNWYLEHVWNAWESQTKKPSSSQLDGSSPFELDKIINQILNK